MKNLLLVISRFLSAYTSLFIILIAIVAIIFPSLFGWVRGLTQTLILGFIMLTMGLTLTSNDLKILASRPVDILIGTMAQFTVMPLVAWTICEVGKLDTALCIGLILVGCSPGGVSSNIMSYLCKGDIAYSVGMTTASTLLSPIVTPLLVLLLAGERVEVDTIGMFVNILLVTIIPVSLGFAINHFAKDNKSFETVRIVLPSMSVLGLACIVGGVISTVRPQIIESGIGLLIVTFIAVLIHNTSGYVLGYFIGKVFKFNIAKRRTISIEVGMQNAGLATVMSSTFFAATNPMSIVPCAISCAWHSISGTILAGLYSYSDRNHNSK